METVLNFVIAHADNVCMLLMAAVGSCGFVWIKTSFDRKMDGLEFSLNKKIDGVDHKIDMVESSLHRRIDGVESSLSAQIKELKYNDFAHLNGTIEILIHTLEKNGALQPEDKAFLDSRLAHS